MQLSNLPRLGKVRLLCVSSAGEETLCLAAACGSCLCFRLQPPHVINHVKWQKAQGCQDCEGDLMELKMGCFVMMQSILFHLGPTRSFAFTKAPDSRLLLCQQPKSRQRLFQCAAGALKSFGPLLLLLERRVAESGSLCQSSTRVHLSSTLWGWMSAPAQLTRDWG